MENKTRYWIRLDEQHIQCELCPRRCLLREGQRGFCFVRQVLDGQLVLGTYGRSTGFCIDPIEKKPLNHFLPGTPVLSFGTAGCNLGCRFCQNWTSSKSRQVAISSEWAAPETIASMAKKAGCRSVAFTYNDPVIWAEYAIDTAIACREIGIKTVAVTAGYITEAARSDFFRHMDAANVDLKAFTQEFYRKLSFANLQPVLETLIWLREESDVWFEVTTLLIPGRNDGDEELERMAEWYVTHLGPDVPWHFSAFHPAFKMLDSPRTPVSTLTRARQIAIRHGIKFVYTGNVHDEDGDATRCPSCSRVVIERDWYELLSWNLKDGCCVDCGQTIPGLFDDRPGDWGSRRKPLRLP